MNTIAFERIEVVPDHDSEPWWTALRDGTLSVPICDDCGYKFFPASPSCVRCAGTRVSLFAVPGTGEVYSYNVVVHPTIAAFAPAVPYAVVLVSLDGCDNDDGTTVRVLGTVAGPPAQVGIHSKVRAVLERHCANDYPMLQFEVEPSTEQPWRLPGRRDS